MAEKSSTPSVRYKTIVADPPWEYRRGFPIRGPRTERGVRQRTGDLRIVPLQYPSLTLAEIEALPVQELADSNCRLFLWTTNAYLPYAFSVIQNWGFRYGQTLVWHKTHANLRSPNTVAPNSAEFLLTATIGAPGTRSSWKSAVIAAGMGGNSPAHSRKPELFLDLIEQVSPGPYLELFARRQRLGWDTWGNEALNHVEMTA